MLILQQNQMQLKEAQKSRTKFTLLFTLQSISRNFCFKRNEIDNIMKKFFSIKRYITPSFAIQNISRLV